MKSAHIVGSVVGVDFIDHQKRVEHLMQFSHGFLQVSQVVFECLNYYKI